MTSDLSHSPSCWRAASWVCAGLWSQQTPAESWSEGGLSWPLKTHNPPKRCDSGNSTDGHSYRRHRYSTRSSTLQATYSSAVAAKTEVSTLGPASRCDPAALRVRADWICHCDLACWLCAFHHHPLGVLKQHVRTKEGSEDQRLLLGMFISLK